MRNESRAARSFAVFAAIFPRRLWALAALLVAGVLSLGSSVCGGGDISHDFSNRWHKGRGLTSAEWTPDGSRIVFGHAGRIYVVAADGSGLNSLSGSYQPLTLYSETAEIDFSPTLSPDGSRVAYATLRYAKGGLREHTYEIAVQPIDGSERVRLTNNERDDIAPSWSPDGSRIAFASPYYGNDIRIFTIAPDGADEREIVPSSLAAQCCTLAWSPDSGRLAFMAERRETASVEWANTISDGYNPPKREVEVIPDYEFRRQSIYTVKADGSGLVELAWSENPNSAPKTRFGADELREAEEAVSVFRWSPDGKRIAFVAGGYGEKDGIYIADAEGASVRRVFDLASVADSESDVDDSILEINWSPDGSRIEFTAGRYAYFYRANLHPIAAAYSVSDDGSDLHVLVPKDMDDYLKWHERVGGSGPKRIVTYAESDAADASPELKGWILSTTPWDESDETVLARIVDNRVVAANPRIPQVADVDAACAKADARGELASDCRTLLEIRDALAGDAVLYWTSDKPISEWPGITVEDGRVRALESVPGVQLSGTIPPAIAELTELRTLNLEGNELGGEIPPELGNLSKLEVLDVGDWQGGHNRIAGRIPPELGKLSNLRILDLSGNALEGEIPPELGGLAKLEELRLHSNPLHGGIPPELGNLSSLRALYLGDSLRNATIPPELGNLANLEELSLLGASLTGGIPPELGRLSNLRELDLRGESGGGLTGPIPRELANLTKLQNLYLNGNRLEGPIPPELGNLAAGDSMSLGYINLSDNRLTGCVPSNLGRVWYFYADIPLCE